MGQAVFLSHSSHDKAFARKLAEDLKLAGITVWVDEAEIKVGDSLIQKIQAGIDEMDYLAIILSPDSVSSEWVKRELSIALTEEISNRRVKVLPLLYRDTLIPTFLRDKKYADFRDLQKYQTSLRELLTSLGAELPANISAPPARIDLPFVKDTLEDVSRSARNLGLNLEILSDTSNTMLNAILQTGLIRIGLAIYPERTDYEMSTSYLLSQSSRELDENPHKIDAIFAIVEASESVLTPYELNDAQSPNLMLMHWKERDGREPITGGLEIFLENLKQQRR